VPALSRKKGIVACFVLTAQLNVHRSKEMIEKITYYEIKCRKTKRICVIKYEQMFIDCLRRFFTALNDDELLARAKEVRHLRVFSY
jgi:hypothetical protein